ncbi:MAG: hypothetical protein IKR05_12830 [Prevotella sp.]|nr:hypothetical protein [Prevotella sp.]
MKKYIFITTSLYQIGGIQCYLAQKTAHLEKEGWKVSIFFAARLSSHTPSCPIPSLEKYLDGNMAAMSIPPYKMPKWMVNRTIGKMISIIGESKSDDEIIIESHADTLSQWGELLASRINARHYLFLMNERYRGAGKYYVDKMDFYIYKYSRKEILGSKNSFPRLFNGFLSISPKDITTSVLVEESPVQDVFNKKVAQLPQKDWNICYLGRGNKPYVPNILSDVGKFASENNNKTIQLIVVGDINIHRDLVKKVLSANSNLTITELGIIYPIPKMLYEKVDVVIANSGCARHSCEEGAIVIVADPETKQSLGILGYETTNSVFRGEDSVVGTFSDALKRVLIDKAYLSMENNYPPRIGIEKCIQQHFELFSQSERNKEYFNEGEMLKGSIDYRLIMKKYLIYFCSKTIYKTRERKKMIII